MDLIFYLLPSFLFIAIVMSAIRWIAPLSLQGKPSPSDVVFAVFFLALGNAMIYAAPALVVWLIFGLIHKLSNSFNSPPSGLTPSSKQKT